MNEPRTHEVVERFERLKGPNDLMLMGWIVNRQVIFFEWQSQSWLPWFQFTRIDMTPQPQLKPVFAELMSAYDSWEIASWFVRPNPWLAECLPVDHLLVDLPAVLHAARADRFIANG